MKKGESITMSPEAKKLRNEYMKKWRKAHPDRVREYSRRRWEKLAEAVRAKDQESSSVYSMVSEKVEMR